MVLWMHMFSVKNLQKNGSKNKILNALNIQDFIFRTISIKQAS